MLGALCRTPALQTTLRCACRDGGKKDDVGLGVCLRACPIRECRDIGSIAREALVALSVHEEVTITEGALFDSQSDFVDSIPMSEADNSMHVRMSAGATLVHEGVGGCRAERACIRLPS